ncbi:MAG: S8/S53 family peptidase [Bacteroidota bacterium]
MKRNILLLLTIGFVINSFAQIAPDKYYIQFANKTGSPYNIDNPSEFLTQRALDRRANQGIEIVENDIPVNANYLQGVADIGVDLLNPTRWLNGVTVYTDNPALITEIEALPYVVSTVKMNYTKNRINDKFKTIESNSPDSKDYNRGNNSTQSLDYGYSFGQIDQLNGIPLHDEGYQGQGMVIAVLDAGYTGALTHPILAYLFDNDRILGTKDFVYIGGSVYNDSEHGKMVLSCMGGNLPGEMIGTAPEASYWLLRPEEAPHENIIEEYNWMSAAEFADSVGADVINSSLGYIDFDNPIFDHNHGAMNGDSTVVTRAADYAASKGILVVNSAGNSGGSSTYPWIGAPADGDSVFSIGAVNLSDQRASFSSIGPTADGRIKPTVMACGEGATIATGTNGVSTWGNGTSFSSPIMAGMSICLWQAHPEMSIMELQEAIKQSGSFANDPDDYMGWGIPNFYGADSILTSVFNPVYIDNFVSANPNPFKDKIVIDVNIDSADNVTIELINMSGSVVISETFSITKLNNTITITSNINSLPQGVYFLRVVAKNKTAVVKLVKE